jgi:starvation-inducible outer membrane lipoprotein
MNTTMCLGETDTYEVWVLPTNTEAYSPRILQDKLSRDNAGEYATWARGWFGGAVEVVRVQTTRTRVELVS